MYSFNLTFLIVIIFIINPLPTIESPIYGWYTNATTTPEEIINVYRVFNVSNYSVVIFEEWNENTFNGLFKTLIVQSDFNTFVSPFL